MPEHWTVLMLLVAALTLIAHGRTLQSNKDSVTSLARKKDAVRQMDGNNLNLDKIVTVRKPSSAVQDWSLVCQQLCGAGFGGAVCTAYCKKLPLTMQLESTKDIIASQKDLICSQLCGLQLGDDACTCKNYIIKDFDAYIKAVQQTNVCAIICDHKNVTLTSCTPCKRDKNYENLVLENFQTLFSKQVASVEAETSNTPDWKELCASLCKTGDGGSLCNCDLSPFI